MQVREVMSRDVAIVNPDTTLREAAVLMRDTDSGFLPVGENDRLVGAVTDRDITMRAVADGKDPNSAKVREAMSSHIAYCFEDQDTKEACTLMGEKQVRRLPVLNRDKRLVGVVTLGDLATRAQHKPQTGEALGKVSQQTGQPRNM